VHRDELAKQYQGKLDSQPQQYHSPEEALKKRFIEMESELKLYRDSSKGVGKNEKGDFIGANVVEKKTKKKGAKPKGASGGPRPHTKLPEERLADMRPKVLSSLKSHWDGARLFVDRPEIPMDNHLGEQEFRDLSKLRNKRNGVFSEKFASITAIMLGMLATLKFNGVDSAAPKLDSL